MQYVWLGVLIASILLEVMTAGLFSIWFVPPALIAMILAFFNVPLYLQLTVFFGLSILLIVFSRTIWRKYITARPIEPTNADALIGQIGIVIEAIDNVAAVGAVKVNGQVWSARTSNNEAVEVGSHVKILAIEGVKLICEKQN